MKSFTKIIGILVLGLSILSGCKQDPPKVPETDFKIERVFVARDEFDFTNNKEKIEEVLNRLEFKFTDPSFEEDLDYGITILGDDIKVHAHEYIINLKQKMVGRCEGREPMHLLKTTKLSQKDFDYFNKLFMPFAQESYEKTYTLKSIFQKYDFNLDKAQKVTQEKIKFPIEPGIIEFKYLNDKTEVDDFKLNFDKKCRKLKKNEYHFDYNKEYEEVYVYLDKDDSVRFLLQNGVVHTGDNLYIFEDDFKLLDQNNKSCLTFKKLFTFFGVFDKDGNYIKEGNKKFYFVNTTETVDLDSFIGILEEYTTEIKVYGNDLFTFEGKTYKVVGEQKLDAFFKLN